MLLEALASFPQLTRALRLTSRDMLFRPIIFPRFLHLWTMLLQEMEMEELEEEEGHPIPLASFSLSSLLPQNPRLPPPHRMHPSSLPSPEWKRALELHK